MTFTTVQGILCVLLSASVQHGSATTISNLNVIFETFQPMSMVRFYEFNDVGWNISERCIKDMFLYLDGLHKDILWAIKLYDASGYYGGNVYGGKNYRLGDPELCHKLNQHEGNDRAIRQLAADPMPAQPNENGQNLTIFTVADVPFRVHAVNARYRITVIDASVESLVIHQTVCMPKSCSHYDLTQVMSFANISHLRNGMIMRNAQLLDVRIIQQSYDFRTDVAFVIFIGAMAVFVIFGIVGTTMDYLTNFDVKINLSTFEPTVRPNTTTTQFASNLNGWRNYVRSVDTIKPIGTKSTLQNVSSLYAKDFRLDNFLSTFDADFANSIRYSSSSDASSFENSSLSEENAVRRVLLCFSWRRNMDLLQSSSSKHCIHEVVEVAGLRVLCLLWILLIHVCTIVYYLSDNKLLRNRSNSFSIVQGILGTGSLAIDTHFFLCGIGIAHMFFNRMKNIDVVEICSCFDTLLHLISMIAYKTLSTLFPYLIALLTLEMLMKYFYDFSAVDIPSMDHITCHTNMWRNIFYIDQFYPLEERCMVWSWILSMEVQCFVISSIILLILKNHPRFGIIIFASFFITALVTATTLRFHALQPDAGINADLSLEENLAFFNGFYDQPWSRLSPYIFGILVGYFLRKIDTKLDISSTKIICGWIACCISSAVLIFSKSLFEMPSTSMQSVFALLVHIIWAVVILWIIIASISKHSGPIGRLLNSKHLLPFSKMTYCFLLIHPIITRAVFLSSNSYLHLSSAFMVGFLYATRFLEITFYFGFVILTMAGSFMLYLIYQAPMEQLLRIVYNRTIKKEI